MVVRATTSTTAIAPFNILDVYTDSAAAYSFRKLRGTYSGAAVRVRRSNDNAEQDIGFDAFGNLDELSLVSFVGVNSGFVTTWYDQSGNVRNATQAIAATQPRIVNDGVVDKVNGRPVLFSVNNTVLRSPLFTVLGSFSYFSMENTPIALGATNAAFSIYHGNSTSNGHGLYQYSNRAILFGGKAFLNNGATVVGSTIARSAHRTDGAGQITSHFVNSSPAPLSPNNTEPIINVQQSIKVAQSEQAGQIKTGELIYYQTDQSTNRATIEANIMSYYGIN